VCWEKERTERKVHLHPVGCGGNGVFPTRELSEKRDPQPKSGGANLELTRIPKKNKKIKSYTRGSGKSLGRKGGKKSFKNGERGWRILGVTPLWKRIPIGGRNGEGSHVQRRKWRNKNDFGDRRVFLGWFLTRLQRQKARKTGGEMGETGSDEGISGGGFQGGQNTD